MMRFKVRVDSKGRIIIPKALREATGIRAGDEVILQVMGDRIIVRKEYDPFEKLGRLLGDLSFNRSLRLVAEEEALREIRSSTSSM